MEDILNEKYGSVEALSLQESRTLELFDRLEGLQLEIAALKTVDKHFSESMWPS